MARRKDEHSRTVNRWLVWGTLAPIWGEPYLDLLAAAVMASWLGVWSGRHDVTACFQC